jgi:hypothetical protein
MTGTSCQATPLALVEADRVVVVAGGWVGRLVLVAGGAWVGGASVGVAVGAAVDVALSVSAWVEVRLTCASGANGSSVKAGGSVGSGLKIWQAHSMQTARSDRLVSLVGWIAVFPRH